MDVIDIALLSREMTAAEEEKYPDLETHWIGSSAVVIIAGDNVTTTFTANFSDLTPDNLYDMYSIADSDGVVGTADVTNLTVSGSGDVTLYRRSETRPGPEYIFSKYIADGDGDFISGTNAVEVTGDQEMLEKIADDPNGLGFVDYRFALEAHEDGMDVNFIGVNDGECRLMKGCVDDIEHMNKHIQKSLNGGTVPASVSSYPDPYPMGLLNNMYMVTNGWPSSVESRFINFAQQPDSMDLYTDAGYFSLLDVTEQP